MNKRNNYNFTNYLWRERITVAFQIFCNTKKIILNEFRETIFLFVYFFFFS